MKHFHNASLRRTIVAIFAVLGMLAVPNQAQAGRYDVTGVKMQ